MNNRKHKRHEEHENHERWLVSYADFITLLFAFFVVLYATSSANEEKQKKFEDSVKLNLHLVGAGSDNRGSEITNTISELNSPIEGFPRHGGPGEVQDFVERRLSKSLDEQVKKNHIQNIRHDAVGVRIALAAATFFPEGSSKLKVSSLAVLDQLADLLKTNSKKVIIEGHTDDMAINNELYASNWELAANRATAVVRYFIKVHKLDSKRFVALSYGDTKPIAPNDKEENRAQNRRIEIFLVMDDQRVEI